MKSKTKQSQEALNLLIDNHPDAMAISDLKGKILAINEKLAAIFGKTKEDLIGTSGFDNIDSEAGKRRSKIIEKVIKTKKPIELIDQERERWWKAIFHPILDNNGTVVKLVYYIQDITKEKEDESEIQKSEDRYRTLFEGYANPVMIFDKHGNILMINKVGASNLNLTKEECIGKSIFELLPNLDNSYHDIYRQVVNTGKRITKEDIIEIPSLGKRCYWSVLQPISDGNDKRYGVQVITYDITDRKKAEQETKKSKNYLQKVIDSASEIIFTIDSELKIRTWNKSAKVITGYKKSHVVGKSISKLTLFENQDELKDFMHTIFEGKVATLEEVIINTSFGIKRIFSVYPSFMLDESKNISEILFVCRDISYEKEIHGKLLFGEGYLISEATSETVVEIFAGMLRVGHPGLYISRASDSEIKNIFTDVAPTIIKLSKEKDKKHLTCSNFEELIHTIEEHVSKENQSIVLLERIEYLIVNSSFESVIKNIYRLNDMIRKHNCLLLLRISPSLLDKTQMTLLREELQELPEQQIDDVQLEETLFEILDYIKIENRRNSLVTYSKIRTRFSIAKVTVQRRIELLLEKELVFFKKLGRMKTLYITDKGKNLLTSRSFI